MFFYACATCSGLPYNISTMVHIKCKAEIRADVDLESGSGETDTERETKKDKELKTYRQKRLQVFFERGKREKCR